MFTFQDRKGRSISLRPEGTAGVVRAYIENNLFINKGIKKYFYFGPMFRAERPQKGRLREFHQFGVEVFGSNSPILDAEIIKMNLELFNKIGLKDLEVKINSVGCKNCIDNYKSILKKFLQSNKEMLCENCKIRAEKNPLRVFDCKESSCQKIYDNAPKIIDYLCPECQTHFNEFKKYLNYMEVKYKEDFKLVRGFDYYTRSVFEILSGSLGAQNAILGGGRYDNLIENLFGRNEPAVGAACGIERIIIILQQQNIKNFISNEKTSLYVASAGTIDEKFIIKISEFLRKNNFIVHLNYSKKNLKAQLDESNKMGINFTLILGEDEIKENIIIVKNMSTGEQAKVKVSNIEMPVEILNITNKKI